jgi:hypothetical protein
MINGDVAKGIGILVGYFISWVLVIILVGIVGVFGFWVWGMVDAAEGGRGPDGHDALGAGHVLALHHYRVHRTGDTSL